MRYGMCHLSEKMVTCLPVQILSFAIELSRALNNPASSKIGGNMSEKNTPRFALPARLLLILGIFLSVLILILVYSAGWIGLPYYVMTSYQNKNCESALSVHKAYLALYPGFMQDQKLSTPIQECKQYLSALEIEKNGQWSEAFDAFEKFSTAYPNSLFASDVHERSASALMNIVKELAAQERYEQALVKLNLVISGYSDSGLSADAWSGIPSTYTAWGKSLQDAGEFEKAEQVFQKYKTWIHDNQKSELEKDLQKDLAGLYLAWGLAFESQEQYENALAKFDQARSADPEPLSALSFTTQAKDEQRKVYVAWGSDFLERDEIPQAMEKFKVAISLADGDQDNDARDALAGIYIQEAVKLRTAEDFRGALEQLELAKTNAGTAEMQKSVASAFDETYLAFSNSSGSQAQRAMKDALKAVCEKKALPFPIFGLNQKEVRFGIFGADVKLPDDLRARTPGEMHYVACVDVDEQILDSRVGNYRRGMWKIWILQRRIKLFWNTILRKVDTGEELAKKTFEGSEPPQYPSDAANMGDGRYFGNPPSMPLIKEWLLSVTED
jgi:tetratricopeptide (TPR) repeat protein